MTSIKNIFVAGAGQLGGGIAQAAAASGFRVTMMDTSKAALDRALGVVDASVQRRVAARQMTQDRASEMLGRLTGTVDPADARDADFVIEAVPEVFEIKRDVLSALDKVCPAHTILASNTTSIPVTRLGAATGRPDRVIGMHFGFPVTRVRYVELTGGFLTSDETMDATIALSKALDKSPGFGRDYVGFGDVYKTIRDHSNRGAVERCNEAVYLLFEGRATVEEVDASRTMTLGKYQLETEGKLKPQGILAWMDYVGLDTLYNVMNIYWDEYRLLKYAPCPLLRRMVEAGALGRKSGSGFYDYRQSAEPVHVSAHLRRFLG